MTFEKALELLKQGKKVRRQCFNEGIYWEMPSIQHIATRKTLDKDLTVFINIISLKDIIAEDWEEYKESLLTEEKEYLKLIIKFHPEKITSISVYFRKDYNLVYFKYKDDSNDCVVTAKDYFKNLEDEKDYTLEELGLEE